MGFKYKAIAMDIDGTLLNSERQISQKTKDALLYAQSKGVRLILSTNRPANITYEITESNDNNGIYYSLKKHSLFD